MSQEPDVRLRTSERNLFKRCQWAWERSYVDRLSTRRESPALWFGTGIHLALEKWYVPGKERGEDPIETWEEYCDKTRGDTQYVNTQLDGDSTEVVEAKTLGSAMLKEYLKYYGTEPHLEVIQAEQTFNVKAKYPALYVDDLDGEEEGIKTREEWAEYVGTIDLVVRDSRDGKVYLWDHKTAKQLGSSNTQYLPLDDQAGSYWAVADLILRDKGLLDKTETISGIVYNYLVKRKPDERPRNAEGKCTNKPVKADFVKALEEAGIESPGKASLADLKELAEKKEIEVFGAESKVQPAPLFERKTVFRSPGERKSQIGRIKLDLQAMSIVRNGVLPATKSPTQACSFCEFKELCELDESGKDWKPMAEGFFDTWDPYAAHRDKE